MSITHMWIAPGKSPTNPENLPLNPVFLPIAARKPAPDKALRLLKTFKNVLKTATRGVGAPFGFPRPSRLPLPKQERGAAAPPSKTPRMSGPRAAPVRLQCAGSLAGTADGRELLTYSVVV